MKNFITIKTYTYPFEYEILKIILKRKNISFFFENETSVSILPFYSYAIGGIHLKVHKDDKIKVLKIIDDLENQAPLRII